VKTIALEILLSLVFYVFPRVTWIFYKFTHVLGSTLTEVLRFRQEVNPELSSSSKVWWSGRQPCY